MTVIPAASVKSALVNYETYDFRRPTTLARQQSRALELAFETFSRQWGTQLSSKTRGRAHVSFTGVSIRTYDAYASDLPGQTALALLELSASPSDGKAVIQFPGAAALGWISRMLGGGAETSSDGVPLTMPERQFTQIEQALMRRVLDDTIDDLRYSFGAQLQGEITFDGFQHNSQFAQAAAPADLMVVATFQVAVGERAEHASVALPAEVILPGLSGAQPIIAQDGSGELVRRQLVAAPLEVAVQFSPMPVTAARVIALSVGDIVALPHPSHKPLNVAVDGLPIARASVGTTGSRLACVVVDTEESTR